MWEKQLLAANRDVSRLQKNVFVFRQRISFKPSINLGNESNVLSQITGKENISELDEEEKE